MEKGLSGRLEVGDVVFKVEVKDVLAQKVDAEDAIVVVDFSGKVELKKRAGAIICAADNELIGLDQSCARGIVLPVEKIARGLMP